MFTGIVEELGRVRERTEAQGLVRLTIDAPRTRAGLGPGESVAVNGCCTTVAALDESGFSAEVMPQTLSLTTLGALAPGDPVNLERALRAGDRLGGHYVQGHVDGVGTVTEVRAEGADRRVRITAPDRLARYWAPRGSVAVDGVSLTVAAVDGEEFEVALIPTTLRETIAGAYEAGDRVNLEADLIVRYLERLLDRNAIPIEERSR